MAPLALGMGMIWGSTGVVLAQAVAKSVVGISAAFVGWRYVRAGRGTETPERAKA